MFACPLCQHPISSLFHTDKKRKYYRCHACALVFVDPDTLPDRAQEKAEYDLHENSLHDEGYKAFLNKVAEPLCDRLAPLSRGLDFGCGPGPALAEMLNARGFETVLYDPIYKPDLSVLDQRFDFITCTEAVEHFHTPKKEWRLFYQMLKPQGLLAIMTKRVISQSRFSTWHYKNDPTHVSFYSDQTFVWLQNRFQLKIEYMANDVVIMRNTAKI